MSSVGYHPVQQQIQNMILSQQQIQSLKILELDIQELNEFLQEEFMSNPVLEWSPDKPRAQVASMHADRPVREGSQGLYSSDELWKKQLLDQLHAGKYSCQQQKIFLALVEWADEDGLFRTPLSVFCESTGCPENAAAKCLSVLQELEPPGIFSTSIEQSLIKQAEKSGHLDDTLREIILHHLDAVASGYSSKTAAALGLSKGELGRYAAIIRALSPYPLNGSVGTATHYVVPDVVLHNECGQWEIILNESVSTSYCISPYYAALYQKDNPPALQAYLKDSLNRARMILNALHQRQETIVRLTKAIVQYQQPWLEYRGALFPITMSKLAEQLHVHPSTISRAVRGKYIETPTRGIIAMKDLFSRDVSAGGISTNAKEVQEHIRTLISREPTDHPYSDQKIVSLLELQNIFLSRRTVAKYRQAMMIPSAFVRHS